MPFGERVGVSVESSSPPLFIGEGGVERLKFQPQKGVPSLPSLLQDLLVKAPKSGFPKSNQKVLFTIHGNIFPRPLDPKIFL